MKYFEFSIKIFILTLIFLAISPMLNTRYQILDTGIALAQSVDLGIYPPVFQVSSTTPSNIEVPFFVQNFQDQSVDLSVSLKPITASDNENGQVNLSDDLGSFPDPTIFDKVKILDGQNEIKSLTLLAKEKRNLTLQINLPKDQEKGDYYFSLIFTENLQGQSSTDLTQTQAAISSNVLLSVGPVGKTDAVLQEFSTPFFTLIGPIPFTIRLKNTSDHYITPKGTIEIKNMYGQTIGKVDLLPVNILSNTTRRIPDLLQSGLASQKDYEKIKAIVEKNQLPVTIWPEKFLLGPYTANLTISISDQGPVFKKEVHFFAFPAEYIFAIIAIIAIFTFIFSRVRKHGI
jgi:hypothetical protein